MSDLPETIGLMAAAFAVVVAILIVGSYLQSQGEDKDSHEAQAICRSHGGIYSYAPEGRVICQDRFEVYR